MRRKTPYAYILIFMSILALMSLSAASSLQLRGQALSLLSILFKPVNSVKTLFTGQTVASSAHFSAHEEELQQLRLENSLLRMEIIQLKESIQHELRLLNQMSRVHEKQEGTKETSNFLKKRHRLELQKLLNLQLQATPAKVIFRSPGSWGSSLWIDVGSSTNDTLGSTVISKNSPVLIGTSIIGVIDYVGKKQSRVKLITDSGLNPSVRVQRTISNGRILAEKIHNLIQLLQKQKNILSDNEEGKLLIAQLENTLASISSNEDSSYLAKGELHGSSKPLWRTERHLLEGIGFNYDFADGEGPARELRSGRAIGKGDDMPATPIVKVGDLLVTTGMDGVFPPDLLVAEVTKIHPLKEGDYYYELEAIPTAGNLDDLTLVFVIPAVEFDSNEHPLPAGW